METGTHEELLARGGRYQDMVHLQTEDLNRRDDQNQPNYASR